MMHTEAQKTLFLSAKKIMLKYVFCNNFEHIFHHNQMLHDFLVFIPIFAQKKIS